MIVNVVLENKTRVLDRLYSYKVPKNFIDEIKIGSRVIVPFGRHNGKKLGIVVEFSDEPLEDVKLKEVFELVDKKPIVSETLIELAIFMRKRYLSDYSSSFQRILPPSNWKDLKKIFILNKDPKDDKILRFFKKPRSYDEIIKRFDKSLVDKLLKNEVLQEKYDIANRIKIRMVEYYRINTNEKVLDKLKNAPVQEKIYKYIYINGPIDKKTILTNTNASLSSLKALIDKKLINCELKHEFSNISNKFEKYKKISLNTQQEKVKSEILNSANNKFLIHGITGSGKTEIYLQIVEEMLKKGKYSIVLVPEISLTPQTIERFSGRFPGSVAVLHSKLTQREKFEQWQQIENGTLKIVIGARSAIFAPVKNLGAIIIDEEHDQSYISDMNPKYVTREVAEFLADKMNSKLILGSATPSIETYNLGKKGIYKILKIDKRATSGKLPNVHIIDMREELKKGNMSVVGEKLHEALEQNLKDHKQSILFLNKRGHTSYVFCRRCGYVMNCNSCDVSLTYHKSKNILICHQCGRTQKKPEICPNCGSKYIREFGAGTEKVEEYCKKNFPSANIFRMDADTVSSRKEYLEVFNKMKKKDIDILIGTQMITKGFDFPDVTLVGVIAADLSLNTGTYKSSENTFQLITQVSGRAGRGTDTGNVYIQTYKPNNYAIKFSSTHDYSSFYNTEIAYRQIYRYPPFYTLFSMNISGENRSLTRDKLFTFQKLIRKELIENNLNEIETLGPNPSPISRINNRYRFYTHYKYKGNEELIKNIFRSILLENKYNIDLQGYKLSLTLNPTNFI
ncbi:MAG: primosomal protein N' [Lagierella massiliensis]|nr:primosomal protein N' [Lagierella massiliensis]